MSTFYKDFDPPFRYGDRDWVVDFSLENGNYQNSCARCKLPFIGHKRRFICKICATTFTKEKP